MTIKLQNGLTSARWTTLAALALCVSVCLMTSCGPTRGAVASSSAFGYCPVCHMKVKATDDWAAEIYYKDQTKLMFESPGDMLTFYTAPDSYNVAASNKDKGNIEKILVKDYQNKQSTDARQAVFVYQSRVEGPMGPDFLPFALRADAEKFVAENGGTPLSLNQVTPEMCRDLRK
ncbi:MAG TPA: nitrous oxide reductase accessory protein NosL [Blastocatellia bacterium]|nr:nitrous oxide reductase accessory protein NosL [Blastocatellia bacterium]